MSLGRAFAPPGITESWGRGMLCWQLFPLAQPKQPTWSTVNQSTASRAQGAAHPGHQRRTATRLPKVTLFADEDEEHVFGQVVAEEWSANDIEPFDDMHGIHITGAGRAFLGSQYLDSSPAASWAHIKYRRLLLLDRSLSFTVDLSHVPCGCVASISLVQMSAPDATSSGYCDISGYSVEGIQPYAPHLFCMRPCERACDQLNALLCRQFHPCSPGLKTTHFTCLITLHDKTTRAVHMAHATYAPFASHRACAGVWRSTCSRAM